MSAAEFHHANPDVREFVNHSCCGFCRAPRSAGLMVNVDKLKQRQYRVRFRCLRCGNYGVVVVNTKHLEVGETADPVAEPVGTDEVIDIHALSDEKFVEAWGELVQQ